MTTLVIWDVDGTLADSRPWIYASYRYAARATGFPEPTDEELGRHCCGGLLDNISTLFGLTGDKARAMGDLYRSYYAEECLDRVCTFNGVPEVLRELKDQGVKQAVATMKIQSAAEDLLGKLGILDCFTKVSGADLDGRITKTQMIRSCMESIEHDRAVMIGDCPQDMQAAREAGAGFVAAMYGYGFSRERCMEEGVPYADSPRDILRLIS